MTPWLDRHDMTERSDTAAMIEPKLTNEPIEKADVNDPMLPLQRTAAGAGVVRPLPSPWAWPTRPASTRLVTSSLCSTFDT
jgi:hypothetical protein